MIKVKHLTKSYGSLKALDDVSFQISEGQILGFLGPNGAGKSTTMNIITGYISCDEGSVEINGINMLEDPIRAKREIGYLPEQPPLYGDMTVEKYLRFVFQLKKLKLPMEEHIEKVCQLANIADVRGRVIKHLSKGYCQRVGLAQALLGDPKLLILDEPTVGLDPRQIIEIRRLIRDLGKDHTILLSSHLLGEVSAVCDRVVVINHGKIAANELTASMTKTGRSTGRLVITVEGRRQTVRSLLSKIDGVTEVTDAGEPEKGCCEFIVDSSKDVRRPIFRAIARTDFCILAMRPVEQSLEDTYMAIISGKTEKKEEE